MDLLGRLKSIRVSAKQVTEPKPALVKARSGYFKTEKAEEIMKLHLSDPLTWNTSVLSRIYKISEDECFSLLRYVRPMYGVMDANRQAPTPMFKKSNVFDMKLYKEDENYMRKIKKLVFVRDLPKLSVLALDLDDHDPDSDLEVEPESSRYLK